MNEAISDTQQVIQVIRKEVNDEERQEGVGVALALRRQ